MLLDPVALDVLRWFTAWRLPSRADPPIAIGQVLLSTDLSVQHLQQRSGALVMGVGRQRWQLFPSPQALWTLQDQQRSGSQQVFN
ncbi:hypothetical protein [Synechococcus sp. N19]|uniref:hypothetical protein n=1 Tax=Synechococcus sp. N19 TaxID=2575512 RepID=UPI001A7E16F1|nr:hypothetical protein [Synechococcus sp. N19]